MCFWTDLWCGEEDLSSFFPSLFALATHKEALVANIWVGGGEGWSPCFSRSFNNWEVEEAVRFF